MRDVVGTPLYIAPEVLRGSYGVEARGEGGAAGGEWPVCPCKHPPTRPAAQTQADVWSAGVILYMLLSGRPPFYGTTEEAIFGRVLSGKYDLESGPWAHISEGAKRVVRGMLTVDPSARWTVERVLADSWMCQEKGACHTNLACRETIFDGLARFQQQEKARHQAAAAVAAELEPGAVEAVRQSLVAADIDGDGRVSVADIKTALARAGSTATAKVAATFLRAYGRDGVEYDTFLGAARRMASMAA